MNTTPTLEMLDPATLTDDINIRKDAALTFGPGALRRRERNRASVRRSRRPRPGDRAEAVPDPAETDLGCGISRHRCGVPRTTAPCPGPEHGGAANPGAESR